MNETLKPDYLIIEAMLVEEELKLQIKTLTQYRRKISNLLERHQLSPAERQQLENLMNLSRGNYMREGE